MPPRVTIFHRRSPTNLSRTDVILIGRHIQTNLLSSLEQLGGPAQRAGHVRRKPRVNTARMEHVTTIRDQLDSLSLMELAQANWAVINHRVLLGLTVGHEGKRIDRGGVEAALVVGRWRTVAGGEGGRGSALRSFGEAADVDGEEAQEEKGGEEDEYCEGHGGVEGRCGVERSSDGGGGGGAGACGGGDGGERSIWNAVESIYIRCMEDSSGD